MKRTLNILLAVAALTLLSPAVPTAHGQGVVNVGRFVPAVPVYNAIAADDTSVALIVKYIGTATSATVAVDAATGDLAFQQAGAADTTLECPVVAPLGGGIDVSDAACNTLGEVVDTINSSPDWRAVLVDGMRADSSNNTLTTIGATQATVAAGLALTFDTDVALHSSIALVPTGFRLSIQPYIGPQNNSGWNANPFTGTQTRLVTMNGLSTYGAGTSVFQVWSVKRHFGNPGTETARLVYTTAAGATTVRATLDHANWGEGLLCDQDSVCIVRIVDSDAMASVQTYAYGEQFVYRGQ